MSDIVNVQYIGFEAKKLVREYSFVVRRALNHTSEFTLTIELESFRTGHVRFQDARRKFACSDSIANWWLPETILQRFITTSARRS
jgi:hypothetical protein